MEHSMIGYVMITLFFISAYAIFFWKTMNIRILARTGLTLQKLCGKSALERETARYKLYDVLRTQGRVNNTVLGSLSILSALILVLCILFMVSWMKNGYRLKDAPVHYVAVMFMYLAALSFLISYRGTVMGLHSLLSRYIGHFENVRNLLYSSLQKYEITKTEASTTKTPGDFSTDGKAKFRELMVKRILSAEDMPSVIDAESRYNELLRTSEGWYTLMSYTNFDRNAPDFIILSEMLCNTNITRYQVEQILKEVAGWSSPTSPATHSIDTLKTATSAILVKKAVTKDDLKTLTDTIDGTLREGQTRPASYFKDFVNSFIKSNEVDTERLPELQRTLKLLMDCEYNLVNIDAKVPVTCDFMSFNLKNANEKSLATSVDWLTSNTNFAFPLVILRATLPAMIITALATSVLVLYPLFHFAYKVFAPGKAIVASLIIILLLFGGMYFQGMIVRASQ